MKTLAIEPGAIFLVPVAPARFATGVVIRADGRGRAVGAFFGPTVNGASEVDASDLRLEKSALICRFGDHGLYTKRWPVIGQMPNWSDASWSVSRFARRHDNPDLCYVTEYDASLNALSERVLPAEEGQALPDDAQYGSGIVEAKLANIMQ